MKRKEKPPNGGRKDKLMIKAGNIISTIGVTLFILSGCCLDSEGVYMYIAGAGALLGMLMVYIGYEGGRYGKNHNRTHKR